MTATTFVDVEDVVKEWLLTQTAVTALLNTAKGSRGVFLAMPKGSPLPCVVLSRVGGAPALGDVPDDVARVSFDVWANNRPAAKAVGLALVSALFDVNRTGFTATGGGRIVGSEVVLWLWQPDTVSETSRYVVDAQFTVITT